MLMEINSRYRLRTETGLRYHLLMQTRSHSLIHLLMVTSSLNPTRFRLPIHLLMVTSSLNPTRFRLQTRWLKATDSHYRWNSRWPTDLVS